jgi:hypothetical protein
MIITLLDRGGRFLFSSSELSDRWVAGHGGPDRRCAALAPARRSRRRSGPALQCRRAWRSRRRRDAGAVRAVLPQVHRQHLAHVGVVDRHTGDGGALGVGGELDVVGRPETTVGHLHACACASVVEARSSFSRGFLDAGSRLRLITTPQTMPPSIPTNPATGPLDKPAPVSRGAGTLSCRRGRAAPRPPDRNNPANARDARDQASNG